MDADMQQMIFGGVVSVVLAGLGYLLIRIEGFIKRRTGIEIEAIHRSALHSALNSGARVALMKLAQRYGVGDPAALSADQRAEIDNLKTIVRDYVKKSVPDALRALRPDDAGLAEELVEAAIAKALSEIK